MTQIVPRRYGFPVEGYVASRGPDVVPLTKITADSFDVLVSSIEQHIESRLGSAIQGDSMVAADQTGLLEDSYSARPKAIFPFHSSDMVDGSVRQGYVHGNEADTDRKGQFGWRSTNGADKNHVYGDWFGSTHYTNASGTEPRFKMVPMPYLTKGGATATPAFGLTRCAHALAREFTAPGTRSKPIQVGDYLYFPNALGAPWKYSRNFNDDPSSGSADTYAAPWGMLPPLHPPNKLDSSEVAATGTDANWTFGDRYYLTVFFEDEFGNYSAVFRPRPVSDTVTAGKGGLVTIGDGGAGGSTGDTYRSVTYENIPIGPPGTRRRHICRTPKLNELNVAVGTGELADLEPLRLYLTGIIENNTQTQYIDSRGQDIALEPAPFALRLDRMWAPCGFYAAEFDERVAIAGATRFNPCALVLGPTGSAGARDLNAAIDSPTIYGSRAWFVRIDRDETGAMALTLANATLPGTPIAATVFTLGPGNDAETLESLVDQINATLHSEATDEWGAQVVTGMDPHIDADQLSPTSVLVDSCTATGTTLATTESAEGTNFDDVAIGMRVRGTGIVEPTYVTAKATDQSLTLSQAATSSGVQLEFHNDTGDDASVGASNYGYVRAYNQTWPVVIPLRGRFYDSWAPVNDQRVFFTTASTSINTLAAESFVHGAGDRIGNIRSIAGNGGHIQNIGAIRDGLVIAASKRHFILENRRNTGNDEDYKVYRFADKKGCIAWDTFIVGDDWIGDLTPDGFWVADRDNSAVISPDLWRPGLDLSDAAQGRGVLAYEVSQCILAADRKDFSLDHAHAALHGNKIHMTYRSSNLVSYPDRRVVYDFGGGAEASGVREVVKDLAPNIVTYPWSAPFRQRHSVLGVVEGAMYGAVEANAGTNDGRIDRIDFGGMDECESFSADGLYDTDDATVIADIPGSFLDVPVGAVVTGTDIPSSTTILSVDEAGDSLVLSATPTGAHDPTPATLTFHAKRINGIAYWAADAVDDLKSRKSALRVAALYRAVAENGRAMAAFRVSRDRARLTQQEVDLPDTGASDRLLSRVEVPYEQRTPGEIVEFAMVLTTNSATAQPSRCWGMDAEVEVMRLQGTGAG